MEQKSKSLQDDSDVGATAKVVEIAFDASNVSLPVAAWPTRCLYVLIKARKEKTATKVFHVYAPLGR